VPVVAIGGVALDNAASCRSVGAAGIAAIRLFQNAKDIASIVKALRTLNA
jgi:thiamine monophosphate synthase